MWHIRGAAFGLERTDLNHLTIAHHHNHDSSRTTTAHTPTSPESRPIVAASLSGAVTRPPFDLTGLGARQTTPRDATDGRTESVRVRSLPFQRYSVTAVCHPRHRRAGPSHVIPPHGQPLASERPLTKPSRALHISRRRTSLSSSHNSSRPKRSANDALATVTTDDPVKLSSSIQTTRQQCCDSNVHCIF